MAAKRTKNDVSVALALTPSNTRVVTLLAHWTWSDFILRVKSVLSIARVKAVYSSRTHTRIMSLADLVSGDVLIVKPDVDPDSDPKLRNLAKKRARARKVSRCRRRCISKGVTAAARVRQPHTSTACVLAAMAPCCNCCLWCTVRCTV
jgi:hypothetical protein